MKLVIKILLAFLSSTLFCGAKSPSLTVTWDKLDQYDTIVINGRIYAALGNEYFHYRDNICMSYPKLNESRVRDELDKSLIRGYIYPEPYISEWIRPILPDPKDLEALPYFITMYCDNRYYLPDYIGDGLFGYLQKLCTKYIQDDKLFELGYNIASRPNSHVGYSYHKPTKKKDYIQELITVNDSVYGLDSLRVRVVAHNDRNALSKLEKYYHDKGDYKGIAIYYKVMLGYKGNGDLAEKFFKTLEPYFTETPGYKAVVREVLIRAALCDRNERAAELCDSLGFTFCDYRLPLPER